MRDRKKDKGVKICPNVTINDSDFIEPPVKRDEVNEMHPEIVPRDDV